MTNIVQPPGNKTGYLLKHRCAGFGRELLHLPGAMKFISRHRIFQKPVQYALALLNAIHDIYLPEGITVKRPVLEICR